MRRKIPDICSAQIIGRRLQQRRRELGYSQTYAAKKINVSRSCISNWEHGVRKPDCYTVKALCRLYNVPMDYIYGTSDHKYNIKIPDYFEIDFTKLDDNKMILLYNYYTFLISDKK